MKIGLTEYQCLKKAVRYMADWRGSLVGNPDPAPLKCFDTELRLARRAVRKLGKLPYKAVITKNHRERVSCQ